MNLPQKAAALIKDLDLTPHPEGGYYREVYRSDLLLISPRTGKQRAAVTDIYFLLVRGQFSRFHLVIHDEIWNFYEGDPLQLVNFDQTACTLSSTVLGHRTQPVCYKHTIRGNTYQAAEPLGDYALVGCTVAPGFDFADFSFLDSDPESLEKLHRTFPEYRHLV